MTRILVVEGDEEAADAIHQSLGVRPEWVVTRAKTILEAIRAAGESTFDAAILEAELPDGSGLDILDFLRIGSPGIQIVLVAAKPSEAIAFHALSHGAGDFIVKDKHFGQELPRRIDALLDRVSPESALVETLAPMRGYDEHEPMPAGAAAEESAIDRALASLVGGNVVAAGVFDLRGRALATRLFADMDPEGLGFALATIHGQIGALWTYGGLKPTGYEALVDVEGGLLAITAIPGTYVVAVLFEEGMQRRRALERLEQAAKRVHASLHGDTLLD